MYNIVKRSMSFNMMTEPDRRQEYEDVLNDPLCSITSNKTEVVDEIDYDADTGKPLRKVEHIIRIVEWDEKVLL